MAQEQTHRGGGGGDDDEPTGTTAAGQERREKLTEETDDLLDEIDDVLEENAEDFVRAYVQKGGQGPGRIATSWPSTNRLPGRLRSTPRPSRRCCVSRRRICSRRVAWSGSMACRR